MLCYALLCLVLLLILLLLLLLLRSLLLTLPVAGSVVLHRGHGQLAWLRGNVDDDDDD